MWPFKPKQLDINLLPPLSADDCVWGVAESGFDSSPLIIRYNQSANEWVGHTDLPIKLGFAVPLNNPHENGLPDPDENELLSDIEDVIVREVGSRSRGLYVLALTIGGMKEFVFYIPRNVDIKAIHESIMALVESHEVQCIATIESRWDSYAEFVPT